MASGCRTGEEFIWAWDIISQEPTEASQYLDRQLGGPLVTEVEGAGAGKVDVSTRRDLTTWVEDTRAAVLVKALEQYPNQAARPVLVHSQLDNKGMKNTLFDNTLRNN